MWKMVDNNGEPRMCLRKLSKCCDQRRRRIRALEDEPGILERTHSIGKARLTDVHCQIPVP